MLLNLHSLTISLLSDDQRVNDKWRTHFDFEIVRTAQVSDKISPDLILNARVVADLPTLPESPSAYYSSDPYLSVYYVSKNNLLLSLTKRGQVTLQFPTGNKVENLDCTIAEIVITEASLQVGGLEDITSLAMAPFLRRSGLFLVHASAAAIENEAVLFVGPSGSGKTTCGLALVASGWQYLANDMALIRHKNAYQALLSPGTVQITPTTTNLLPHYSALINKYPIRSWHEKALIPRLELIDPEKSTISSPIRVIIFPSIENGRKHQFCKISRAVGLAKLMESSMDQWDQEIWEQHINFLISLSQAVTFYELSLGSIMSDLPEFLQSTGVLS